MFRADFRNQPSQEEEGVAGLNVVGGDVAEWANRLIGCWGESRSRSGLLRLLIVQS